MIYEKDNITSISKDKIAKINKSTKNLRIENLPGYENNGKHLRIHWNIPISITRNEDRIWLTLDEHSKDDYWVAYGKNWFTPKQFENLEDAITYSISEYAKWLNSKNELVDSILDDLTECVMIRED